MKQFVSLKNWKLLLYALLFLTSFVYSKQYTDPFFVPKNYFFFFVSAAFLIAAGLHYYNRKFKTTVNLTLLDLAVALLVLYSFLRLLLTPGMLVDNVQLYLLFFCSAAYFVIKPWLFNSEKGKQQHPVVNVLNILLLVALGQVVWGFVQYSGIAPNMQKEFKIGGAFGNPGQYTNFLTPLLAFSLASYFFSKSLKKLSLLVSIAILFILPFTEARTSWVGAAVVIVYLADKKFSLLSRLKSLIKSTFLRISLLAIFVVLIIGSAVFLYNLKKNSSSGRLFIWQVSTEMVKDKPLFGFGFDRFASAHNDYQALYFKQNPNDLARIDVADGVNYAFNEFIQQAVEAGIVGLILLLLVLFLPFKQKLPESVDDDKRYIFYAAKGSLIVILISALFSYPFHTISSLVLLFFSLAIIDTLTGKSIIQFEIEPSRRKLIAALTIVIMLVFISVQYGRNKAEHKWLEAYSLMRQNKYDAAYSIYTELYPTMRYNQYFLFNFGAELTLMKRSDESIKLLKEAEPRLNDADFYIYLGTNYENRNDMQNAEACFTKASQIMPSKFFPQYKLVVLYMNSGRKAEGLTMAKHLVDMKVKVPSPTIDAIRLEMTKMLEQNNLH